MLATYEPIASTTLSSAASSISLTSIPGTFTDLRLVFRIANTGGMPGSVIARFNGSTSGYSLTRLTGTGQVFSSTRYISQNGINIGETSSGSAPTLIEADVMRYAGSTYKTIISSMSADWNGSGYMTRQVGLWQNTAAITSIVLSIEGGGGNMVAGTTATLYGIKAA